MLSVLLKVHQASTCIRKDETSAGSETTTNDTTNWEIMASLKPQVSEKHSVELL